LFARAEGELFRGLRGGDRGGVKGVYRGGKFAHWKRLI